jgi:type I restriction enzyme S subunit
MKPYPSYKESGYDWTGNIPAHWKMVQLKFAAPRKTYQTENVKEFGFQVALENIESKTGKLISNGSFEGLGNIFRKGDVLFNKLRPYLCKVVIAPQDGVAVSELLVLRPREDIDNRYLFYRLLESKFISVVDGSTYGAKMPRANWDFIGELKIPVPPFSEQQAIADFLTRKTTQIDMLIQKKQRQIELLREMRDVLTQNAMRSSKTKNLKLTEF